ETLEIASRRVWRMPIERSEAVARCSLSMRERVRVRGMDGRNSARRRSSQKNQPFRDFVGDRADVTPADVVEVGQQRIALRREIARVGRIGVGAANELNLSDVMRRHHTRIAGMKLVVEAIGLELVVNGVD